MEREKERERENEREREREREIGERRNKQPETIAFMTLTVKHVKENKH